MRSLRSLSALVALLVVIGAPDATAGQTVHHVGVVANTSWGTTEMPVSVPRHDPALGRLLRARICIRGETMRRVRVESLDAAPSVVDVTGLSSALLVQSPSDPAQVLSVRRVRFPNFSFALSAADGALDFGGTSGADTGALRRGLNPIVYDVTDAAGLAHFSGAGSAVVPFAIRFESHVSGSGNLVVEVQAQASLTGVVIYEYEDAGGK